MTMEEFCNKHSDRLNEGKDLVEAGDTKLAMYTRQFAKQYGQATTLTDDQVTLATMLQEDDYGLKDAAVRMKAMEDGDWAKAESEGDLSDGEYISSRAA